MYWCIMRPLHETEPLKTCVGWVGSAMSRPWTYYITIIHKWCSLQHWWFHFTFKKDHFLIRCWRWHHLRSVLNNTKLTIYGNPATPSASRRDEFYQPDSPPVGWFISEQQVDSASNSSFLSSTASPFLGWEYLRGRQSNAPFFWAAEANEKP